MSRIRSIKPELPQDERVGRLSREARLCWLMCFTLADDEGRFRAHPALVKGACYPYDPIEAYRVEDWLAELQARKFLLRYRVDGEEYAEIANWPKHQKIDHPTPSRLPSPAEGENLTSTSATLAKVSEGLAPDMDMDQDRDMDQEGTSIVPNGTHPAVGRADVAEHVFEAWKGATGRNGRTVLTAQRRKLLARWLPVYPPEILLAAAAGVRWSPHHMGDNDRGTKYDSLELIFRDEKHIELFSGYELDPSTRPTGRPRGKIEREIRGQELDPALLARAYPVHAHD